MINEADNSYSASLSSAGSAVPSEKTLPKLTTLTGLRFLAALLIVCHHIDRHFRPGIVPSLNGSWGMLSRAINNLLYVGNEAVSFFFVLSGFILAYSYSTLSKSQSMRTSLRRYAVARVARIYPVYVFSLLIATGPAMWFNRFSSVNHAIQAAATSLALVQTWPQLLGIGLSYAWNGPGWSLSVEAFFYLMFPVCLLIVHRLNWITLIIGVVVIYYLALSLPIFLMHSVCLPTVSAAQCGDIGATLPISRLPEFIIGVIGGVLLIRSYQSNLPVCLLPPGLALTTGAVGLLLFYSCPRLDVSAGVLAPFWLLITWSFASWELFPRKRSSRISCSLLFSSRSLCVLGEASFSLYLLHWPLWDWITRFIGTPGYELAVLDQHAFWLCVGYVSACLSLSLLCLKFIETPARKLIQRRLS